MKEGPAPYSDEQAYRIAYLIAGFIGKTLTEAEHDELDAWIEASDENMRLFEELTDEAHLEANLAWMQQTQTEHRLRQVRTQLTFTPEHRASRRRFGWPYLAAASVLLICALLLLRPSHHPPSGLVPSADLDSDNTIQPGSSKATLSLSDGTTIDLDRVPQGLLRQESGTRIHKAQEGTLTYTTTGTATADLHTLTTPTGGQYTLTLSDGTRVWLNAASSLKYPAQFSGGTRTVELSGEGYFDVAKNREKPFIVRLPAGASVRVLGTRFNAATYPDEEGQKITLEEGSILLSAGSQQRRLQPGEQGLVKNHTLTVRQEADLSAASGWKEGVFVFHDADIHSIMRQVKRWYAVEVVFRTNTSEHFNATISRSEPVSRLLHLLELTGKIHFKIENHTIYVLP